jgi:hypothetical protein
MGDIILQGTKGAKKGVLEKRTQTCDLSDGLKRMSEIMTIAVPLVKNCSDLGQNYAKLR